MHQIGVSLIKYIKSTIILDCFNGEEGAAVPFIFLSILFRAMGKEEGEGRESQLEREEGERRQRKLQETDVLCLRSKVILLAVQLHMECSQSCQSLRMLPRDSAHEALLYRKAAREQTRGPRKNTQRRTRVTRVRRLCHTGHREICAAKHFLLDICALYKN